VAGTYVVDITDATGNRISGVTFEVKVLPGPPSPIESKVFAVSGAPTTVASGLNQFALSIEAGTT